MSPEPYGPADPFKHARQAGYLKGQVWNAAHALKWTSPDKAMAILRETLEQIDPAGAAILWPMEKAE